MFSEIAVHGHLPPWVCTEHHGRGIYGGLAPPRNGGDGVPVGTALSPPFILLAHCVKEESTQAPRGSSLLVSGTC